MIDRVAGGKIYPESIRREIVERTDGIPLFVEEMTKAVLEAGSEDAAQVSPPWSPRPAGRSGQPACVPDGAARPARARQKIAQTGAVNRPGIFSHAAGAGSGQAPGGTGIGAGSSDRRGAAVPNRTRRRMSASLFNHALVQDAAYGTLLRERTPRASCAHSRCARRSFRATSPKAGRSLWRAITPRPVSPEKAAVLVGHGRPTVIGPVGAGRSRGAARARAFADRGAAGHACAPARSDQASDRPFQRADPHQGPRVAGDQGIVRPGARLDPGGGSTRRRRLRIRWCFFPCSTASGSGNRWRSRAISRASLPSNFRRLPQQQSATVPHMIGHMLMGISLVLVGDIANGTYAT